jgi:signal transduction histidine kinase
MVTRDRTDPPSATGYGSPGAAAPDMAPPAAPTRTRTLVALAASTGLAVTLLTTGTSLIAFAYASVPLHVAVETVAAMVSVVAAQLVYGRFRRSLQLHDVLLLAGLCSFAATNLLFSAVPAVFDANPGRFATWAPVGGSLLSTALLAAAAFQPERTLHRPAVAARRSLLASAAGLAAIAVVVLVAGDALPTAVDPGVGPTDVEAPGIATDPVVLTTQVLSMALFAAAAAGFAARSARTGDLLARWLAVGATLGAFARLNYALFPSLYTEWFYTGDVLRLGCFVAIFVGAVHETRRVQDALAASALVGERERIARNLHDGVAQDLAFIVQQLRHIAESQATPRIDRLVRAAERALDESRHAVAALTSAGDRPLGEVLAATAHEAGEREGSTVEADLPADIAVPPRTQEELLRLVREAVINAARHGRAQRIRVELRDAPQLCLDIIDDGSGFDPEAARAAPGRLGLASMRARVTAIGGELTITSERGRGTRIRVTLP